jgi:hypothetical protein
MTEVLACLRGIQIAAASNPNKSLWIEADSKLIVDWINRNSAPPFHAGVILSHIWKELMRFPRWRMTHIWREANQVRLTMRRKINSIMKETSH